MQKLTERSVYAIMLMFSEPAIMNELFDGKENNAYSKISVDTETCEIVLGKTRYSWWNSLIGAERRISLTDFAFKVIGVLASKAESQGNRDIISEGLLKDIADSLQREGRSNDIIDRLFLVGYLGVKTAWSCYSWNAEGSAKGKHGKVENINLRVNDKTYTFKLPGSNDPIFKVTIGPKGVEYLGDELLGNYTSKKESFNDVCTNRCAYKHHFQLLFLYSMRKA